MTIYDRIKDLRIELGMTQDDLARSMGYKDRSMITKIEAGKVDISQKKITEFARVLHTTVGYLMGWTDQRWPMDDGSTMNLQLFAQDSRPEPPRPIRWEEAPEEKEDIEDKIMKVNPSKVKVSADKIRLYQALGALAKVDKEAAMTLFEALIDQGAL